MRVVDDLERMRPAVRNPVAGDRRVRAVEIIRKGVELFDAAHVAAEPLADRLVQTVMLLLRAEGLHSCPQMAWAKVHKTVDQVLSPPDELMFYCGSRSDTRTRPCPSSTVRCPRPVPRRPA